MFQVRGWDILKYVHCLRKNIFRSTGSYIIIFDVLVSKWLSLRNFCRTKISQVHVWNVNSNGGMCSNNQVWIFQKHGHFYSINNSVFLFLKTAWIKIYYEKGIIYLLRMESFPKNNISYPVIGTRTCACQAVRHVSFVEYFA